MRDLLPLRATRPPFDGLSKYSGIALDRSPATRSDSLPLPFSYNPGFRSLGRIGELEVLLASKREIKRALRLRYRVFYQEGQAIADATTMLSRRDRDRFDALCDHLVVVDHTPRPFKTGLVGAKIGRKPKIVGTCRLLRQSIAEAHDGFYSAQEFDIGGLFANHPQQRFLELGRFCVAPSHRGKRTAELLWQGIWRYIRHHRMDVLIGCGSLEGTNPSRLAMPLSYLHHVGRAPEAWRTRALGARTVRMDRLAKDAVDLTQARRELPTLLKAYLRLGAFVSEDAVVDHQFGTTDVLVVLPVASIGKRYVKYFGGDPSAIPDAPSAH